MSATKNLSKERKNEIVHELRAYHQEQMEKHSSGRKSYFYPKVSFVRTDGTRVIGMFRSELERFEEDVYIEIINLQYEPVDKHRTLYKMKYNPHFKEEYELVGVDRYYVPMSALEVVWSLALAPTPKQEMGKLLQMTFDLETLEDNNVSQMTIRDLAAILLKRPVSGKAWLNELVSGEWGVGSRE